MFFRTIETTCGNLLQLITKQICGYIIHMHTKKCIGHEGKDSLMVSWSENIDNKVSEKKSQYSKIISSKVTIFTLTANLCKPGADFSKEVQWRRLLMPFEYKISFNCLRFLSSGKLGYWINFWTIEPRKKSTFIKKQHWCWR